MPTFHSLTGEPVLEGKYHLECRIGQGGMGVVYKARHAYLKTTHAIKIILPDLVGNDPQLVTRFRQEALAAAAIRHQNVVGVSDYGVAQGTMPFLVMECVEGESLHDLLTREQRLSPERAFELMSAIGAGVGAAHVQGIVHRDLKPLNVMILKDKTNMSEAVKILDFGLAKIKSSELLGSFIQAQTTGLMGSPYYMAPEQWADEEPDARSDVYSLGVMLFQMLAGDVPFKGSSIPAIMKKHLTDAVPPFDNFGVQIAPQVELAVRHSLEKEPEQRTDSVEHLIEEFRTAVGISIQNVSSTGFATNVSTAPVSTLNVLTNPPQSKVFVDNVVVGKSQPDGWLTLEGLQSGNHHLRVSHDGFADYENRFVCDGKPTQLVADLKAAQITDTGAIPKPSFETVPGLIPLLKQNTPRDFSASHGAQTFDQQVGQQTFNDAQPNISATAEKAKSKFLSPLVLAIIGICGVLLLVSIGVGGAFLFGLMGEREKQPGESSDIVVVPKNSKDRTPAQERTKVEMAKIAGGKFKMGRSDGLPLEQPEHEREVRDFWMDKTEITTEEYYDFVKESGYAPKPENWEDGKPLAGSEKMPVRFVSFDDASAFAAWRSKRDGFSYRLPSEEEWEYAARNGGDNNLYPWGNNFKNDCAIVDQLDSKPQPVGSKSCGANKWGVQDLIGNVYEWTSSKTAAYKGEIKEELKLTNIIRGGSALGKSTGKDAITSTYRSFAMPNKKDAGLGFRLVRSE